MIGLHIIADLKGIDFSKINLDKNILKKLISELLKKYKLTELGNYYHTFGNNNEITCVVALAESHISIHSWPEKGYISLDIFVCNLGENNSLKAKKIYQELIDFFKPRNIEENFIERNS
ncbi:MAG: adenosylmethionine decarboxylase [Candidatus Gracilibacteria bacterium]|nr:adenosylmethionine decarboxylase [Candidatus Gracilibacteria bacterium]MDQ7022135.1 adenosylmethionine decarboxylase [Candidatus Gracilibacteria bacterium]